MQKDFYAVGHISNDLNPSPHVGGGVTYACVVAQRLGFQAHIITKCDVDSPYIKELENMGIKMHVLPVRDPKYLHKTTAFTNEYDEKGNRTQYCPEQQEGITMEDLVNFPEISEGSTVLIAPVIGKVDFGLFEILAKKGHLAVTPQGYFREFAPDGKVSQKPLEDVSFFTYAEVVILSEEDLGFDDGSFTEKLKQVCSMLIITHGEKGSSIYKNGKEILRIPAFTLDTSEIVDFTGAGDSYAASFLLQKARLSEPEGSANGGQAQGKSDEEAGYFASFYSAMKISGLGGQGQGLVTVPTKKQIEEYKDQHKERVEEYFSEG